MILRSMYSSRIERSSLMTFQTTPETVFLRCGKNLPSSWIAVRYSMAPLHGMLRETWTHIPVSISTRKPCICFLIPEIDSFIQTTDQLAAPVTTCQGLFHTFAEKALVFSHQAAGSGRFTSFTSILSSFCWKVSLLSGLKWTLTRYPLL